VQPVAMRGLVVLDVDAREGVAAGKCRGNEILLQRMIFVRPFRLKIAVVSHRI